MFGERESSRELGAIERGTCADALGNNEQAEDTVVVADRYGDGSASVWSIEIDNAPVRVSEELDVEISSGIDWFDLNVSANFGELRVALPELLAAAESNRSLLRLADGSFGVVPAKIAAVTRAVSPGAGMPMLSTATRIATIQYPCAEIRSASCLDKSRSIVA